MTSIKKCLVLIAAFALALIFAGRFARPGGLVTLAMADETDGDGDGMLTLEDDEDEEDEDQEEETKFPEDNGPDTIDVSGYPEEQQRNYKLFQLRCSKCHTISRPINSKFALPEEWSAYVEKMRRKRRSGVRRKDAVRISSFLIYDSSVRKKELIEAKLKEQEAGAKEGGAEKRDE